ncbi:MAG: hypothetical protein GY845_03235 [Planctomycetes bacterium]|nr:hypothetical protein [Planctomycetota bacterium]
MNQKDKEQAIKILNFISNQIEQDVKEYSEKEFNAHSVGALFGKQNAMIGALAEILKETIEDETP